MNSEIIIALIALISTVLGSFAGGIASSSLTRYRIQELEKKVEKHTAAVERMRVTEEQMKVVNHRLRDLEEHGQFYQMQKQSKGGCSS